MDKEKMNARELTEKELEMVSGGGNIDILANLKDVLEKNVLEKNVSGEDVREKELVSLATGKCEVQPSILR